MDDDYYLIPQYISTHVTVEPKSLQNAVHMHDRELTVTYADPT